METKKLGVAVMILSIAVAVVLFVAINQLYAQEQKHGCFPTENCMQLESSLGLTHIAIGVVSFFFSLGFYLLFFYHGEEAVLQRLEEQKNETVSQAKFDIMLRMLDANEQAILKVIHEQDGITQASLVLRTGLSKSMVSEILTSFEKKKLIKREKNGRTRKIRLTEPI